MQLSLIGRDLRGVSDDEILMYLIRTLGLTELQLFNRECRRLNPEVYPRRSGRTTALLLAALIEVVRGREVIILGGNQFHTHRLEQLLIEMAIRVGVSAERYNVNRQYRLYRSSQLVGMRDVSVISVRIFVDHWLG